MCSIDISLLIVCYILIRVQRVYNPSNEILLLWGHAALSLCVLSVYRPGSVFEIIWEGWSILLLTIFNLICHSLVNNFVCYVAFVHIYFGFFKFLLSAISLSIGPEYGAIQVHYNSNTTLSTSCLECHFSPSISTYPKWYFFLTPVAVVWMYEMFWVADRLDRGAWHLGVVIYFSMCMLCVACKDTL